MGQGGGLTGVVSIFSEGGGPHCHTLKTPGLVDREKISNYCYNRSIIQAKIPNTGRILDPEM